MKGSIKNKLVFIILGVLSINIIVILVFGTTFLESFYIHSKKQELTGYKDKVQTAYQLADAQQLQEEFFACQASNVNVLIYKTNFNTVYYSTPNYNNQMQSRIPLEHWVNQAQTEGIFDKLETESVIITQEKNQLSDSIYLYAKMDDTSYLFMETPRAYIGTIAETSMQFFIFLSLGTLVIGIVATLILSNKIAKPIRKIDQVAQKIASMDFSEKCEIHTGDEIEALANSVNTMSYKLKENIDILRHDLEREEQTNKIRREFVANVSHDFKTPISLISAYTEVLKDNDKDEQTNEVCDIIMEQSATMNHLVNQLLTLSQLESGMLTYEMSFFSINDLVSTVVKNCRILLDQKSIPFTLKLGEEYMVKGDYNRIMQVFTNIFENAVKYMDDNKKLDVNLCKLGDKIRVSVFNSHASLSDREINNVFDIFYKSDKSRNSSNKSYGIGLAIVQTIINAHNGSYGVFNHENGVVFWFELENFDFDEE